MLGTVVQSVIVNRAVYQDSMGAGIDRDRVRAERGGGRRNQGDRVKPVKSSPRTAVTLWVISPADLYFCRRVD